MEIELVAPLSGLMVPLDQVPDAVFASKTVGDGASLDPTSQVLVAPCDGVVQHLHRAGHALTLKGPEDLEVLIHIGIDTVNLQGKGFYPLVRVGDSVVKGQYLIDFDADFIANHAKSLLTQVLVLNSENAVISKRPEGLVRAGVDTLMKVSKQTFVLKNLSNVSGKAEYSQYLKVLDPAGLHARPLARIVSKAKEFQSHIEMEFKGQSANAKNLVGLLELEVGVEHSIRFRASGIDSKEALESLTQTFLALFGTSTLRDSENRQPTSNLTKETRHHPGTFTGSTASSGVCVGQIYQLETATPSLSDSYRGAEEETHALKAALLKSHNELRELQEKMKADGRADEAAIFSFQIEILDDSEILNQVLQKIGDRRNAGRAWQEVVLEQAQRIRNLKNELLAARANDLDDIRVRVLGHLNPDTSLTTTIPYDDAILIARNLTPSQTATLDKRRVRGFCTRTGGPTSHVAILARSLGIPALAGIPSDALSVPNGTWSILDAKNGVLITQPTPQEIDRIREIQKRQDEEHRLYLRDSQKPSVTTDGMAIHVLANTGGTNDAREAVKLGAEGSGLLRSEFLFLNRTTAPTEDEQFNVYSSVCREFRADQPVIIRTLDVGGDKPLPYLPIPREDNPYLGERGIRVSLKNPDVFRTQIRALLRLPRPTGAKIMLPMISRLDEWKTATKWIEEERQRLNVPRLPIGIMIEVPAAALLADRFAATVDFFSIGTNDLTQYTLAIDRGHPILGSQADPLDPAVLRLIQTTTTAGNVHGKPTGVCGGLASDPLGALLLIGLGVSELSVSVPAIPRIKAIIRNASRKTCVEAANEALLCSSGSEVRALARAYLGESYGS